MKILSYLKKHIFSLLVIVIILLSTNKICDKLSEISFSQIVNSPVITQDTTTFGNTEITTILSEDNQSISITANISLKEIENNSKVFLSFTPTTDGTKKEVEMKNIGSLDYTTTITLPPTGYYKVGLLVKGPTTTKANHLDTLDLPEIYRQNTAVNLSASIISSDNLGNFTYTLDATNTHKENEGIEGKKITTFEARFLYENEEILFIDLLQNKDTLEILPDKTIYKYHGKHKINSPDKANWVDNLNIKLLAITEDGSEYIYNLKDQDK